MHLTTWCPLSGNLDSRKWGECRQHSALRLGLLSRPKFQCTAAPLAHGWRQIFGPAAVQYLQAHHLVLQEMTENPFGCALVLLQSNILEYSVLWHRKHTTQIVWCLWVLDWRWTESVDTTCFKAKETASQIRLMKGNTPLGKFASRMDQHWQYYIQTFNGLYLLRFEKTLIAVTKHANPSASIDFRDNWCWESGCSILAQVGTELIVFWNQSKHYPILNTVSWDSQVITGNPLKLPAYFTPEKGKGSRQMPIMRHDSVD